MRATNYSSISSLRHYGIVSVQADIAQLLLIIKMLEFIRLKYQLTALSTLIPLYHIVGKNIRFHSKVCEAGFNQLGMQIRKRYWLLLLLFS